MRDDVAPASISDGACQRPVPRWPPVVLGFAGLLGASGVAVGAAGAHGGGSDLARLSSEFLLIHAAVLVAGAGVALATRRGSAVLMISLALLGGGAVLFGGELAVAALFDWRPIPLAAPIGGLCLIAGWLCLSATAVTLRPRRG